MVTIVKPELCQVVSSLNRFGVCPRESHFNLIVRCFGHVQQHKTSKYQLIPEICSDCMFPNFRKLIPDFIKDYPDAKENMNIAFSTPFRYLMQSIFLVYSEHAHDLKPLRSITGLIFYFGTTHLIWYSRRQRIISSSTYAAEFAALRTATEEAQSLCYMLHSLGCNVPSYGPCPTQFFGDKFSAILNS